jgi:ankyrin repeat protein
MPNKPYTYEELGSLLTKEEPCETAISAMLAGERIHPDATAWQHMVHFMLTQWSKRSDYMRQNKQECVGLLSLLEKHGFNMTKLFRTEFLGFFNLEDWERIFSNPTIKEDAEVFDCNPLISLAINVISGGEESQNEISEKVKFLLDKLVDPNTEHKGRHALHYCIRGGHWNFETGEPHHKAAEFIKAYATCHSVNWNLKDEDGNTPLILAAKMRATKIVALLMEQSDKLSINETDNSGRTAIDYAFMLGDVASFQLLQSKDATLSSSVTNSSEQTIRQVLKKVSIDPKRDEGAVNNIIVDAPTVEVRDIITREKKLATKDNMEWFISLLHGQRNNRLRRGHPESIIQKEINFFLCQKKSMIGVPLINACLEGVETLKQSLNSGTGLGIFSNPSKEKLRLVLAAKEHLKESSSLFLSSIQADNYGQALRRACTVKSEIISLALVESLITFRGDNFHTDANEQAPSNGRTALHYAADNGHNEVYSLLKTNCADETIESRDGQTPKQIAENKFEQEKKSGTTALKS